MITIKKKNIGFFFIGILIGFVSGYSFSIPNPLKNNTIQANNAISKEIISNSNNNCDLNQITNIIREVLENELNNYLLNMKDSFTELSTEKNIQHINDSKPINSKIRSIVLKRISRQRKERKNKRIEKKYNICQQTIFDAINSGKWTNQDSETFRNNVYSLPEKQQSELIEELFNSIEENQLEHQGPPL